MKNISLSGHIPAGAQYRKPALFLILLLILVGGLAMFSRSGTAKADSFPCNVPRTSYGNPSGIILHAADWAGSLGSSPQLDVYSNYNSSNCANPTNIGSDAWGLQMQCTEFAVRVADFEWHTGGFSVWWNARPPGQSHWTGAAKDMFRVAPYLSTHPLQAIPNNSGSLPQLGDILVISDSGWGHVGVVQQASGGRIYLVGENQGDALSTAITYSGTNLNSSSFIRGSFVIGWLHAPSSPPPPPNPYNTRYVGNLYYDILNRVGSPGEVNGYVQMLNQGTSRTDVANNFLTSQEYRTNLVNAYFQLLLGRQPNSSELQTALTQLANGGRDEDLLAGLAGSDEFYNRAGGTPNGFAAALYQDLLGRSASSSEIAAVVQQVNSGVPRSTIAQGFVTSQEYYTDLVNGYYQHYLGRQADPSGLTNAVASLSNGGTNESVITGLVISEEYYWK